jgi:hypothetical protein
LSRQYYDVASIGPNPAGVAGLRKLIPNSQLLYGSDEPFNSSVKRLGPLAKMGFSALQRDYAVRLLPRLQT